MSESTRSNMLAWSDELAGLLERANARIEQGMSSNLHLATRRFLELLRAYSETYVPTPSRVTQAVYAHDWPSGGWIEFDWGMWNGYTRLIVAALQSDDPAKVLNL